MKLTKDVKRLQVSCVVLWVALILAILCLVTQWIKTEYSVDTVNAAKEQQYTMIVEGYMPHIDLIADNNTGIVYYFPYSIDTDINLVPMYGPEEHLCRLRSSGSVVENISGEIVLNAEKIKQLQ